LQTGGINKHGGQQKPNRHASGKLNGIKVTVFAEQLPERLFNKLKARWVI